MLCEHCGAPLLDSETICPFCGHSVSRQAFNTIPLMIERSTGTIDAYTETAHRETIQGHDLTGESVPANYLHDNETVSGKLHFEQDRFTFKSNSFISHEDDLMIQYASVDKITYPNTLGIESDGISIWAKDFIEYKFVVKNRKMIINYLQQMIRY